jgi:hypothetical protein
MNFSGRRIVECWEVLTSFGGEERQCDVVMVLMMFSWSSISTGGCWSFRNRGLNSHVIHIIHCFHNRTLRGAGLEGETPRERGFRVRRIPEFIL